MTKNNVLAFKIVRPASTLNQNPDFVLDKASNNKGFPYFFSGKTRARPLWALASLVSSHIAPPELQFDGVTKATQRAFSKGVLKSMRELWKQYTIGDLVNVRKNPSTQTFDVLVPIQAVQSSGVSALLRWCGVESTDLTPENGPPPSLTISPGSFPIAEMTVRGNLKPNDVQAWKAANAHLVVRRLGSDGYVFLIHYVITKEEVQQLVNEEFAYIKPMDVYGPVYEWVSSYYGQYGRVPAFAMPLRNIARAVAASSEGRTLPPRTNEEGLIIDEHAEVFWLPPELQDINRFEDTYSDAYSNPDTGVFGIADLLSEGDGIPSRKKPPTPMPVYVDWLNLKFSYTNLNGRLEVKSLDRCYPVNVTQAFRALDKKIVNRDVDIFFRNLYSLGVFYGIPTVGWKDVWVKIQQYARMHEGAQPDDIKILDAMEYATPVFGDPLEEATALRRLCSEVLKRIEESPETAYARYSVPTILALRGRLSLMVKYWISVADLRDADKTARRAYLEQKADPDYKLPPLPFIAEGRGLLPHQAKALNLSKESPANVVYPVDAGGGKTMIYISDILREMGHFKTPGPYMIMCPAHLVAQYVKELVYATDGRLNAIAITSYTIRRHGFDRLKAMIEAAPLNSVLIVDYNVITYRSSSIAYGTDTVRLFPVVEFLRQFNVQVMYSDETHYLKAESTRQQAAHRLISDIPKKRGASGTFAPDTIKDLVRQAVMFDPTIFGTMEDFVAEYALETRGSKVLAWRPGTEALVKARMRENFIYAEAKRKEWAAILPFPVEAFHRVSLTPKQEQVYGQILNEVVQSIQAEMESNKRLQDLLIRSPKAEKTSDDDEDGASQDTPEDDGDDEDNETVSIDSLLKPYLSRLERFITAPGKDKLGAVMLEGDDLISPKVSEIVRITMDHVNEGMAGKVLIFTNYTLSAEAIYEGFPESFRDKVVFYTAGRKEECGALFEKDDSKQVMVGVEQSMNTGLNLQHASRLIRCETVWTPGVLEQGNARIGRPNVKKAENRPYIYYDWIVGDRTIDVTKISYLMAKTISVAKYNEAGVARFDDLEVPPLFSMTLDTIRGMNDFDTTLVEYFEKYEKYRNALAAEYAEYREKNRALLFNEDGTLKMEALVRAPNLEGAKLLRRVPYVPGTELYKSEDLGLIRYDAYMRMEDQLSAEEEGMDDSEEEMSEDDDNNSEFDEERKAAIGLAVHTDRGDGEIVSVSRHRLTVELASGQRVKVMKLAAFVITRGATSNNDIRTALLKMVGDVPLDAPVDVLEKPELTERERLRIERQRQREQRQSERQARREQRQADREQRRLDRENRSEDDGGEDEGYTYTVEHKVNRAGEKVKVVKVYDPNGEHVETFDTVRKALRWVEEQSVEDEVPEDEDEDYAEEEETPADTNVLDVSFTIVNDILGLRLENVDDQHAVDIAQQYGFRFSPEYYAVAIPTAQHLLKLMKAWHEAGFTMPKDNNETAKQVYMRMQKTGRKALPSTFGFASELELRNFYREEMKPNPKENVIMPYPMVQDGELYIALPARGHPSSLKAVRVRVPGLKWMKYDAESELILFTRTKEKASSIIKRMLGDGVKFADLKAMKKQFQKLRVVRDEA